MPVLPAPRGGRVSAEAAHRCRAETCDTIIPPRNPLCRVCFDFLPRRIQDRIWDAYLDGKLADTDETRKWCVVRWRKTLIAALEIVNETRASILAESEQS